jgi:coproporphyrinogen III oxidase-like Fe-S oxidoreductase
MPEFDPDDFPSVDAYFELFGIEDTAICAQWRAERWIMEFLLMPAKVPRRRTLEHVINVADKRADVAEALAALERDGLIERDGETVSATKAAISFWRLELAQASGRDGSD